MPEAVALATASPAAQPSVRMVLLKGFGEDGFRFFSNYDSQKGRELAANPRAALLFHWDALGRQVRIAGPVQRASEQETAEYVRSRPRQSQLSALASPQSEVVEDRQALESRVAELETAPRRHRAAAAAELGRLSPRPRDLRVLAAAPRPAARPAALPPRRRRAMARRAPGPLGTRRRTRRGGVATSPRRTVPGRFQGFARSATSSLAGVPSPVIESKPGAVFNATFCLVQLPVPPQNTSLPS